MTRTTDGPDPWRSTSLRCDKFSPMDLFTRSIVLLVANEVGIFECLAGGALTLDEAVARLKTDRKATRILLDALVALRYLRKEDGRYENDPETRRCLTEDSPEYVGTRFRHSYHGLRQWLRLEDLVRKGQSHKRKLPEFEITEARERQRARQFAIGLHESSRETASLVAEMLDLEGVSDLLDLGGGAGSYSMAFAKKWPALKITLFELPIPARVARELMKEAGLAGRIRVQTGHFLRDNLGRDEYDAVFMSNVIHLFSPDDNRKLIRKAHQALSSGGKILVKDMMTNDERDGPFHPLFFALTMLMFTDDGDTYSFSDVRQWMREAGFARIRRRTVIPHESYMLIGSKR